MNCFYKTLVRISGVFTGQFLLKHMNASGDLFAEKECKVKMRLNTLKKNKEFRYLYHKGRSITSKNLVLIYRYKKFSEIRMGFTVSKKVGGAVVRNRVRRRMKEAFIGIYKASKLQNAEVIFVARKGIENAPFLELVRDMKYVLTKAKMITHEKNIIGDY